MPAEPTPTSRTTADDALCACGEASFEVGQCAECWIAAEEAEQVAFDAEFAHLASRYGVHGTDDHLAKGERPRARRRVTCRDTDGRATAWRTEHLNAAEWHTTRDDRRERALTYQGERGAHHTDAAALTGRARRSERAEQSPQHAGLLVGTLAMAPGAPSVAPGQPTREHHH
jgi:hypothetical protein